MSDLEKKVALRLPQDVYKAIEDRAVLHMRSVNNEIIVLLKLGLVCDESESEALVKADEFIKKGVSSEQSKEASRSWAQGMGE